MIAAASSRPVTAEAAPIEWVVGDVQTWQTGGAPFDVVLSRFGVMFFADAAAAFANLHEMIASDGRLCVAVWAHRPASPLFDLPLSTTLAVLHERGVEPASVPAEDWGPFSLGDVPRVVAMVEAAGWRDVAWTPHELSFQVGGGMTPDDAAPVLAQLGPTRAALLEVDQDTLAAAEAAIAAVLRDHVDANGNAVLDGKIGIITARA